MQLSEFMNYINAALNYPAIEINDILVYCDMAMSELNTTLHINIPLFSEQLQRYSDEKLKNMEYLLLAIDPSSEQGASIHVKEPEKPIPTGTKIYYDLDTNHYYIYDMRTGTYVQNDNVLGVYYRDGVKEFWAPLRLGTMAIWELSDRSNQDLYDLNTYLPNDWIMLWLVPYVCFKYTVRDGGTAQTFAEELTQGFQQLQDTYDIPDKVILATVADKEAYKDIVLEKLPNLNVLINVLAIYDSMKHERNVLPEFGSMYDRGGF